MATQQIRIIDGALHYPAALDAAMAYPITNEINRETLISFANNEKAAAKTYRDYLRCTDEKDIETAQALVVESFESLAENGELRRHTETKISALLRDVRQEERFELHDGELNLWRTVVFRSLAGYCAYMLGLLIGFKNPGEIRRCPLSECRKFFWAPLRRGPRATYCSERHRTLGVKREARGKPL